MVSFVKRVIYYVTFYVLRGLMENFWNNMELGTLPCNAFPFQTSQGQWIYRSKKFSCSYYFLKQLGYGFVGKKSVYLDCRVTKVVADHEFEFSG